MTILTIMLGLLIIIGSTLVITLNLFYKNIIKEFYDYIERDDNNGDIK